MNKRMLIILFPIIFCFDALAIKAGKYQCEGNLAESLEIEVPIVSTQKSIVKINTIISKTNLNKLDIPGGFLLSGGSGNNQYILGLVQVREDILEGAFRRGAHDTGTEIKCFSSAL